MILLIVVIGIALVFDTINGFHDAANAIATIVTTRVLTTTQAVVWAAFFNFIAYLVFGLHVADTIAKGIVETEAVTLSVILSGLIAAIGWNLLTWWLGIPSSSSHTLIGGFVGAAMGSRITHLTPFEGFSAEAAGSAYAFWHRCAGHTCKHYAHYCRRHSWGRSNQKIKCGEMGNYPQHCSFVDNRHSHYCNSCFYDTAC